MRAFFSYGLAFSILLLAAGWLATGTLVIGGQGPDKGEVPIVSILEGQERGPVAIMLGNAGLLAEHAAPTIDPHLTIAQRNTRTTGATAPLPKVRTQSFIARPMPIDVPLRGRTQAKSTVTIVAETTGTLDTVHVSKGQNVEIGDRLCTLDKGTREAAVAQAEAAVAQAEAAVAQAQLNFDTNTSLRQRGVAAANTANAVETALITARASLISAQATLDNAKAELDRTEIVAKISGLVQDPLAIAGSMLTIGSPCATIVQLDPMLFKGMVPEARIGLARLDLPASIETVTGQVVEGKVTYIASIADNATRAFPIEIEIPNTDFSIRDGVTAQAIVMVGTAPGHFLPQSALTLNDDGIMGVRTVEADKVVFYPVHIVSDTRQGVWVTGLPAIADIITIGQENVTDGQAVETGPAIPDKQAATQNIE